VRRIELQGNVNADLKDSLAIARMFGGIPKTFFTTYHQYYPKTEPVDQYDLRGVLYELYHYLNHTVLFGVSHSVRKAPTSPIDPHAQSSYASGAMDRMDRLLSL
jgi:hypothetical protein